MAKPAAVRLGENVWRIPTMPFDSVNSFAFVDGDGQVTLVDTGLKRAPARIVAGLAAIGKHPRDVTRIVLTHAHTDHAGSVAEVAEHTGAEVEVHADDAEYVRTGTTPPMAYAGTIGRLLKRAPEQRFDAVPVATELHEGDVIDVAGGVRVLHTPGHTPGHVALLHEPSGVLVTGDSIMNVLRLRWGLMAPCTDPVQMKETALRLAEEEFSVAAFTHGPEVTSGAREAVRGFLRRG